METLLAINRQLLPSTIGHQRPMQEVPPLAPLDAPQPKADAGQPCKPSKEPARQATHGANRCAKCGDNDVESDNQLLLCDGEGCGRAFHMQCLPVPLGSVPEGQWFCPECRPATVWTAAQEHGMELGAGTELWARDRKGHWGAAVVISSVASEEDAAAALVSVRWKGFGAKYNELLRAGEGRLRPHDVGPPLKGYTDAGGVFLVARVAEMRRRQGEPLVPPPRPLVSQRTSGP